MASQAATFGGTAALAALASGGTVTRPTMALIGEAGPERVEPLDSRGLSNRDKALITSIVGSMMGGRVTGSGGRRW